MVQEIAFSYGFDPNETIEKEIILRIIEIVLGGSDIKFRALGEIEQLILEKQEEKGSETSKKSVHIIGARSLEKYTKDLTVALVVRLAPRSLPLISIGFSAYINHQLMNASANAGFMVYRQRFILRKKIFAAVLLDFRNNLIRVFAMFGIPLPICPGAFQLGGRPPFCVR